MGGPSMSKPQATPAAEHAPSRGVRGVHPEQVFCNGRILTMDGPAPVYAQSLVIRGGIIVFVGDEAPARELLPERGSTASRIY